MKSENMDALHVLADLVREVTDANTDSDHTGVRVRSGPLLLEQKLLTARRIIDDIVRSEANVDPETLLTEDEKRLLTDGQQFIQCIRSVRARCGAGLREAKELVESAGGKMGLRIPDGWGGYRWVKPGTTGLQP